MDDEFAVKLIDSLTQLNDTVVHIIAELEKYNNVKKDPMYDKVIFDGIETTYFALRRQICHTQFLEQANDLLYK